jgi:hypothetical protein
MVRSLLQWGVLAAIVETLPVVSMLPGRCRLTSSTQRMDTRVDAVGFFKAGSINAHFQRRR